MKIENLTQLQMIRTNPEHFGPNSPITKVEKITSSTQLNNSLKVGMNNSSVSFKDYLLAAMGEVNNHQINASSIQQQMLTDPDSVDIHDITVAMSKAISSLNLAKTVIDRLVKGWSEISTTR